MKLFGLILFCLSFGLTVQAQQVLLDMPYIESVSIDPHTGLVTISWNVPVPQVSTYDVEEFVIYWFDRETVGSPTNIPFASITNPAERSYTFDFDTVAIRLPAMPNPKETSVQFTIAARNRTHGRSSLLAYEHHNTQITSFYDSCRAEIRLNWHRYHGWMSINYPPERQPLNFEKYILMSIQEDGTEVKIAEFESIAVNSFTVQNVELNKTHAFYIIAERSDGLRATSFRTTRFTYMPRSPSYIHALSVQYNVHGLAEVRFVIDPAAETRTFEFFSTGDHTAFPTQGRILTIHGNDTTIVDSQVRNVTYYYRLDAKHVCVERPNVIASNPATALWLTLTSVGFENTLRWDLYQKWGNSDVRYEIHRQIGNDIVIIPVFDPTRTYIDDLPPYLNTEDACYWIVARPVTPMTLDYPSEDFFAISNRVCVKPESDISIPNAFTPNDDGINDEWYPTFTYRPEEYLLIIYDRIGAVVFETRNPDDRWSGRLLNGRPANEGVYAYFIRFKTAMGRIVERRGTLMLVIPR